MKSRFHEIFRLRRISFFFALSVLILSGGSLHKDRRDRPLWIPSAAAEGPRIAVLPFRQRSGGHEWSWLAEALPDLVGEALAVSGRYRLYERGHLGALMREVELERFGLLEEKMDSAAISVIDEAIVGSFEIVNSQVRVVIRRIRVSDGADLQSIAAERPASEAFQLAEKLAAKLLDGHDVPAGWKAPTEKLDAARELYEGLAILRRGDLAGALYKVRKARQISPDYRSARLWEGRIYLDMSEDRLADVTLRRCLDAPPPIRLSALRLLAQLGISHGDWNEAASYLETYLLSAQETGDAADRRIWSFVELGRIRLAQSDPVRAFDALQQAMILAGHRDSTYIFPEASAVNRGGARAVFFRAGSRTHTHPDDQTFALLHSAAGELIRNGHDVQLFGLHAISDTNPFFARRARSIPQEPLAYRRLGFVRGNDDLLTKGATSGLGELYAFAAPAGKRIASFTITQSAPLESREYEHVIEPYQYPGFVRTGMVRVGGMDDPFAYPEHFLPVNTTEETRAKVLTTRKQYRLPSDVRALVLEAVMDQEARPTDWSVAFELVDVATITEAGKSTGHLSFYTTPREARCFIGDEVLTKDLYFGERDMPAGSYVARLELNGKVVTRTVEIAPRRRSYLYLSPWADLTEPRVLAPGRVWKFSQAIDPDGPRLIVYSVDHAGGAELHALRPDSPSTSYRLPFSRDANDISPSLLFGPDFRFHLVWVRYAADADESQIGIWYSQSVDGSHWLPARKIFDLRPSSVDLHVTDKGVFHLAMVDKEPSVYRLQRDRILLSRSTDGIRWTTPSEIPLSPEEWSISSEIPAESTRAEVIRNRASYRTLFPGGDVALTAGPGDRVLIAANLISFQGAGQKLAIYSIEVDGSTRFLSFVNDDPKYPVQTVRLRRGRDRAIYCAWKSIGPLMVARSDDEGRTWSHWILAVPFLLGSPYWSDLRETDDGLEILWNANREEGLWAATLNKPDFEGVAK